MQKSKNIEASKGYVAAKEQSQKTPRFVNQDSRHRTSNFRMGRKDATVVLLRGKRTMLENRLEVNSTKFSKEEQEFLRVSGHITLMEILKDEGYQKAFATALKEEKQFITQYEHASHEVIDTDLQKLYQQVISPE